MITQLSLFMHLLLLAPAFKVQQRHSSCWSEKNFSCAGSPKVSKMPLLWLEKTINVKLFLVQELSGEKISNSGGMQKETRRVVVMIQTMTHIKGYEGTHMRAHRGNHTLRAPRKPHT